MKKRVAVIFGGKSAEHEISLMSAKNVVNALDPKKYEAILIGISPEGHWKYLKEAQTLLNSGKLTKFLDTQKNTKEVSVVPGQESGSLTTVDETFKIDVVFPVLHGPFGEDGTVQGMLKLLNIPYVGPDVLASSVSMDKDVMKKLLRDSKIPVARWACFRRHEAKDFPYSKISQELGTTVFLKPANMGSSIGVHKVTSEAEYKVAIDDAFQYDNKVLVEEQIKGREIECSVLGNEYPKASLPGEVIVTSKDGWYSYDAKYVDEKGADTKIPADLPQHMIEKIQKTAVETFKALGCEGMSRVDMFVCPDEKIYINEINTIPGFTNISMYPKMWEATGLKYSDLIDTLIDLAIQRFQRDQKLKILKD
ncbi:MAG: D-alanine--D-alanine ligase [Bdellovibrionota bacterium]